jgi:MarR family transcriptional regulator for hemolysin
MDKKARRGGRAAGQGSGDVEEGAATLDAWSAVAVSGTRFLELQGRYPPGSLEDLKLRFTRRVIFLARVWRNRMNDALREVGQSHARWIALIWVHLLGGRANHGELAERIGVELPTLIRLLNRLEEEGLVERGALPGGTSRAKTVQLTAEGRRVLIELNEITEQTRADFLAGVDQHKLETCMSLFEDLLGKEVGG